MRNSFPPGRARHLAVLASAKADAQASAVIEADFGIPTLINTEAGRLAVYQTGTGNRTLVFWPSLFTDHTLYRQQATALKTEFRMIYIDGCGHGGSGPQTPGATLDTHARAAMQVLEQLHIERAAFVGTSWGGLVGSHLARQQPQRLTALVALNTPYETRPGGPSFGDRMIILGARLMGSNGLFAAGVAKSFFAPVSHKRYADRIAEFKARLATFAQKDIADAARTVMVERKNALPWLGEISVPTIIVAGREDTNARTADLKRAAALIPAARFVEAPDSAHMSAIESPELVNRLIREAGRYGKSC